MSLQAKPRDPLALPLDPCWGFSIPLGSAQDRGSSKCPLHMSIVGCLGLLLQRRASWKTLLPASVAASLIFYVVTNSVSWIYDPGYAKNFAGLIQSLTVGLPEYSATPSWMFFRNSLISDLVFTFLFVVCMNVGRIRERSRACAARLRPVAAG